MQTTQFIWQNGNFIPWGEAQTHVLSHSLHYGGAIFEGLRCYETDEGSAIFRLTDHMERFLYSMRALKMELPYSAEELAVAVVETVKKNRLMRGYIRPLAFYGYGKMGLNPKGAPVEIIIACWPWGKYLSADALKVKIADHMRIHPQTTDINAKISGHYANSIMASQEIIGTDFDEVLLLDYTGAIAEGPGENIFMVKDGILITPVENILKGITRDTILTIARDLGYEVRETSIMPEELFTADEAFLTGTAAEISPIASVDGNQIGKKIPGPMTETIKTVYEDIIHGRNEKYEGYLTRV